MNVHRFFLANRHLIIAIGFFLFGIFVVFGAWAADDDCGNAPLTVSTEKAVDTKLAISGLTKLLVSVDGRIKATQNVTTVITQFPNADEVVLRQAAWFIICKTIQNSSSSPTEKVKQYLAIYKELRPIPSSKTLPIIDAPAVQNARKIQLGKQTENVRKVVGEHSNFQSSAGNIDLVALAPGDSADGWALRYLPSYNDDPNHTWFVIVKSVLNPQEGEAAIARLRERFPNYEFALYDHYKGSPYMGIMMAAWVTESDAKHVLQIARAKIASDSYLWTFK